MNDDQLAEWSRHYDSLLWNVTTLFAGAVGGLLAFQYTSFNLPVSIFGLMVSIVPVYFAASFRESRDLVNAQLSEEARNALFAPRKLRQWEAYVVLFIAVEMLWMWLLARQRPGLWPAWCLAGATVAFATLWLARRGRGASHASARAKGSPPVEPAPAPPEQPAAGKKDDTVNREHG
jgi:Na+/H+ antiporter NhaD/arsenite permease-like protein